MRHPRSRREFLRAGLLGIGGLSLTDVLRAQQRRTSEKAVILLYLHGGPSHLETYDLKPDAPTEYRSIYRPIATNVPGMDICERFPQQARIADKLVLVRSVHHTMTSHTDGGIEMLTGKTPTRPDPTSTSLSEHPDIGAVASRLRGFHPRGIPQYVSLPRKLYMVQPSYLGQQHGPFQIANPTQVNADQLGLTMPNGLTPERFFERRQLRDRFDGLRRELDHREALSSQDSFRDIAYRMLTSSRLSDAFDLSQEPDRLRDRYGRHLWGQSCLLARRLAEAGTGVITLYIDKPIQEPEFTNWDDHILNAQRPGHFGIYMDRRLPYLDQALSALIEDIYARGEDGNILVAAFGEFGRTPRLSHNSAGTGRDHWPNAMSVLLSGGGLRTGQVIGATNSRGEFPSRRPLGPQDVLATLYRHLGIDPRYHFADATGRPIPLLSDGVPIAEIV